MDRFIARLQKQQLRLDEMEAALAATPASVKERLAQLYANAAGEHEHSIGLGEDSDLGNLAAERLEREHMEELLLRIKALAQPS